MACISPGQAARRLVAIIFALAAPAFAGTQTATAAGDIYTNSYAIVIGIDRYPSRHWPDLTYPRKDAEGIADILQRQGFTVTRLYDAEATAQRIRSVLEDDIAPKLRKNDRVLVFFSGHGHTRVLGDSEYGYLVPYDGGETASSLISMDWLRSLSDKMNGAKHQAFIIDACFGGQLAPTKAGLAGIAATHPEYIAEITRREARQYLTAGGKDQQVLDGGPGGYSYFTGFLIEALNGRGDTNGDGYITMNELAGYLVPRATNAYQTPGAGTLPGHALGEFVFRLPSAGEPAGAPAVASAATTAASSQLGLKGSDARAPEVASLPPVEPKSAPAADERAIVERLLADARDELRRNLTDFMRIEGHATDPGFRIDQIWKARLLDASAEGYTVSIQYDATLNQALRQYESRTRRFRIRLVDGHIEFVALLDGSG